MYLAAVRSLHIDYGFPDPLLNCLRLQRLLKGIKRVQGPVSPCCLPITIDHLREIQRSLDLSTRDHIMLWAVCCLGFFGLLRAGEFTVNVSFQPSIHMTVSDLQADTMVDPMCYKVSSVPRLTLFALAVIFIWGVPKALFVPKEPWVAT